MGQAGVETTHLIHIHEIAATNIDPRLLGLSWSSSVPPGKCCDIASIRLRQLPDSFELIRYSSYGSSLHNLEKRFSTGGPREFKVQPKGKEENIEGKKNA
jgi:hypothetical protein